MFIQLFNAYTTKEGAFVNDAGEIFPCQWWRRVYPPEVSTVVEEYASFVGRDGERYTATLHGASPDGRVFTAMQHLAECASETCAEG